MCFGNNTTTSSTEVKRPEWMESGGKDLLGKAQSFYSQPYKAYEGERVAPTNADQQGGFEALRTMLTNPSYTAEAADMTRKGSGSAAGGIDTYMNPYLEGVLGPAIRKIMEASAGQRKQIGRSAHMSGAFGDARQGVLESELGGKTQQAIGDTSGKVYADAFNTALGASQNDLSRLLTGGQDLMNVQASGTGDLLKRITALLSGGQMQQDQAQKELDVPYQEHKAGQQDQYSKLDALIRALGGAGSTAGQTQTTTKPDNSGFELLGALLKGGLGMATGGASLPVTGMLY